MKKILIILFSAIMCISCSGSGDPATSATHLEAALMKNAAWPYEIVGVLDIVEAGGYEDSDYPSWAVGSIVTSDDPEGVMIKIGKGVVAQAGVDIDSGKTVKAWLGSPENEYGALVYPIEKITAQ